MKFGTVIVKMCLLHWRNIGTYDFKRPLTQRQIQYWLCMTTIDLQDNSYTYRNWLNKSMKCFPVVVGARTDPIHPIGVRLDLNLAILTAMATVMQVVYS
jgi:hypothetical protein